jgi:D-alanyl-D-alanine carboxypeptidase/D-alanyl-D-alanine-endopeptidase (penicillin-binding protein 4)
MPRRSSFREGGFERGGRSCHAMLRGLLLFCFSALLAASSGPGPAVAGATGPDAPMAAQLDALLARGLLAKASVGVLVERARDGEVLYARGADQLFIPASNQKILTALASLARFGPAHRFSTRIWAPDPIDGEGEVGELVVEGGGDPVLRSEDWWRLAADLRTAGLRGVRGDVRVEDALFEGPAWHPSWGDVTARAYHAPIGALTANQGVFAVSVWPRDDAGSAARVAVDPPVDYLQLRNLARTASRRARPSLSVDRLPGAASEGIAEEIVRVEGSVRKGDPGDLFPRSVLDPGLYAGSLLLHQLRANGIDVDGIVRRAPRGEAEFALILERPGGSVAEIVRVCLKQSSNSVAETLVKNLGAWAGMGTLEAPGERPARRGEWAGGIQALRRELEGLGIDLAEARLVDGSGLSLQNRLSPRMLVRALRVARDSFTIGPELVAALPIAHRDGTLERRLERVEGRIRAKTGLLSDAGVTALSGYAERVDGEGLIFSILVNGPGGGGEAGMEAVDRLAEVLITAPLRDIAPLPAEPGTGPMPDAPASPAQEARVAPAGSRTKARITESMYSDGSVVPSRRRRSITPGPQL